MTVDVTAEFIAPLLEFSSQEITFRNYQASQGEREREFATRKVACSLPPPPPPKRLSLRRPGNKLASLYLCGGMFVITLDYFCSPQVAS